MTEQGHRLRFGGSAAGTRPAARATPSSLESMTPGEGAAGGETTLPAEASPTWLTLDRVAVATCSWFPFVWLLHALVLPATGAPGAWVRVGQAAAVLALNALVVGAALRARQATTALGRCLVGSFVLAFGLGVTQAALAVEAVAHVSRGGLVVLRGWPHSYSGATMVFFASALGTSVLGLVAGFVQGAFVAAVEGCRAARELDAGLRVTRAAALLIAVVMAAISLASGPPFRAVLMGLGTAVSLTVVAWSDRRLRAQRRWVRAVEDGAIEGWLVVDGVEPGERVLVTVSPADDPFRAAEVVRPVARVRRRAPRSGRSQRGLDS